MLNMMFFCSEASLDPYMQASVITGRWGSLSRHVVMLPVVSGLGWGNENVESVGCMMMADPFSSPTVLE